MLNVSNDTTTEITAPSSYPVTTADAKSHLRVDISDDDTLIASYIAAATDYAESYTGRSYVQRTYRADVPYFVDEICLANGPVISVSSVKYYDTASPSVLQTWDAGNYQLFYNVVRRVSGVTFPSTYDRPDAVQIEYTAGYLDNNSPQAENIPDAVKQAILLLVGDYYENREAQVLYPGQLHTNKAVKALLDQHRLYR